MNKKTLFICFFLSFFLSMGNLFGQCNEHKLARRCKDSLDDYQYDSYVYHEISFNDKPQTIEVVFSARARFDYKLVFATSTFDENVKVSIYNKNIRVKDRKALYDNLKKTTWSIDKPGTYYIDYQIPPKGTCKEIDGCMMMLIGFKDAESVTTEYIK